MSNDWEAQEEFEDWFDRMDEEGEDYFFAPDPPVEPVRLADSRWVYLLLWPIIFGVWPFADPDHNFGTVTGALDFIIHYSALAIFILCRWPNIKENFRHYASIFSPKTKV